jgi:hypothetical protein
LHHTPTHTEERIVTKASELELIEDGTIAIGRTSLPRVIVAGYEFGRGVRTGQFYVQCWKCAGSGYVNIPVDSGRCWNCMTAGFEKVYADENAVRTSVVRRIAAAKRGAAQAAAEAARYAEALKAEAFAFNAWRNANPNLVAALAQVGNARGLLADLACIVAEATIPTTKQVEAATRILAQRAEADAHAGLRTVRHLGAVGDKITFTGTLKIKSLQDGYAYGSTEWFMIIETPDGDVKITTTAAWADDAERGAEITITGKVKKLAEYRGQPQTVVSYAKVAK